MTEWSDGPEEDVPELPDPEPPAAQDEATDPAGAAPELAGFEPPPQAEPPVDDTADAGAAAAEPAEWHDDPAADEGLRAWLDETPPALEPPPDLDARIAEHLVTEAEEDGASAEDLVRAVLSRLGRR